MSATLSYAKALEGQTAEVVKAFLENPNRWKAVIDGKEFPVGTDFMITSRFGSVRSAVTMNADGTPAFDRPEYVEAPFVQVVTWGRGRDGKYYYGVVDQDRPPADQPGNPGVHGHKPVRCRHVIMGFNEKAATGKFETPEDAAAREAHEEGGATKSAVRAVVTYPFGHNPSPSFTPTWGDVVAVEVDLEKLEKPIPDPSEPINGVYFIEGSKLLEMIRHGQADGAYTGVCTSLSALMIHWAHHPEQFPRGRLSSGRRSPWTSATFSLFPWYI